MEERVPVPVAVQLFFLSVAEQSLSIACVIYRILGVNRNRNDINGEKNRRA
jgi:hypothetical protein